MVCIGGHYLIKIGKSTLLGLIASILFVIGAIVATGMPSAFWNLPSALIIIGGTLGAVIIAFPPNRLRTLGPVILHTLIKQKTDIKDDVLSLVALSEISRKEGLLSMEEHIDEYTDDEFIKEGLLLIIDGCDEEQLRETLEGSTYFMKLRHQKGAAMLDMIAATAPALGLLGTYVGLIPMLHHIEDPSKLGPMMALELISSFYGGFIAYVIFSPLAKRLKFMSGEEAVRREIIIEGIAAIQQGKNPALIRKELLAFINVKTTETKSKFKPFEPIEVEKKVKDKKVS